MIKYNREEELKRLRNIRERECFSIINRGKLWYNMLTSEQLIELTEWYNNWLNATETFVIPIKPTFLENKLNNEEIVL